MRRYLLRCAACGQIVIGYNVGFRLCPISDCYGRLRAKIILADRENLYLHDHPVDITKYPTLFGRPYRWAAEGDLKVK